MNQANHPLEVTTTSMATGGEAIARDQDGRVIFVDGALVGERVGVTLKRTAKRHAHAQLAQVLQPSPHRREAPCPFVEKGCGGCGWQHIEPDTQHDYKARIVRDALERIGGVAEPDVRPAVPLPEIAYRTTVRAAVIGGRAGFHRRRSHEVLPIDHCLVAHPLLEDLFADARYGKSDEVTMRVGERTEERLVLVSPNAADVTVPGDVTVVGTNEIRNGRHVWYHEIIDGHRWRISATSFFQARPNGAEALIDAVAAGVDGYSGRLIDLCCGVGLIGGTLARREPGRWRLTGVERHRPAVHDARDNLADLTEARVVRASIESWRPSSAEVVVADPARAGLGRKGVDAVAATGAHRIVLVNCDPGSLGRDTDLLRRKGYRFDHATLVDLFAQTPHTESVSVFTRSKSSD